MLKLISRVTLVGLALTFTSPGLSERIELSGPIAEPANDPGSWVTASDYPSADLMNGHSGITTFRLHINPGGQPTSCDIVKSSGFIGLDATTCELVMDRARFGVAKNGKGKPIASTYTNRVRWVIPGQDPMEPGSFPKMLVELIIAADGKVESCQITEQGELFANMPDPCPKFVGHQFLPPGGRPGVKLKIFWEQTFRFETVE